MIYTADQKRDNLAKLADYLLGLPEDYEGFEMSDFFDTNAGRKATKDHRLNLLSNDLLRQIRAEAIEVAKKYALENGGVARCGAVACAIGHGPSAGFLFLADELSMLGNPLWPKYTRRVFLESDATFIGLIPEFEWMFGGSWSGVDNTPHGAAKRIRYYLANGVPEDFVDADEEYVEMYNAA